MDPLDHLNAPPDDLRCSVCDAPVPAASVRLLAWRDDLAFLQMDCRGCLSTTLGFVFGGGEAPMVTRSSVSPISSDDVLDMHLLLHGWQGDLAGLLAADDRPSREAAR